MTKNKVLLVTYDRAVISSEMSIGQARELSYFLECPISLSEYIPDNHVSLLCDDKFVATLDVDSINL